MKWWQCYLAEQLVHAPAQACCQQLLALGGKVQAVVVRRAPGLDVLHALDVRGALALGHRPVQLVGGGHLVCMRPVMWCQGHHGKARARPLGLEVLQQPLEAFCGGVPAENEIVDTCGRSRRRAGGGGG